MSSGLAAFAPIVVVPVFNEAETISEVVAAARAHAPVLVVDDGSDDGSAAAARAAGAEVLRHPRRLGKGQAIRTGVAAARSRRASVVVTLDGDGQHDPGDLTAVLGAARGAPRAIVVGSRPLGGGAAIGAYLAGRVVACWAREAAAAGRAVVIGGSNLHRAAGAGPADWWRHPRRRRAAAAAGAMLAAPALLALLALQAL